MGRYSKQELLNHFLPFNRQEKESYVPAVTIDEESYRRFCNTHSLKHVAEEIRRNGKIPAGQREMEWLLKHPNSALAEDFKKEDDVRFVFFDACTKDGRVPTLCWEPRRKSFRRSTPLSLTYSWRTYGRVILMQS